MKKSRFKPTLLITLLGITISLPVQSEPIQPNELPHYVPPGSRDSSISYYISN